MNLPMPVGSLENYIQTVNRLPMLSLEDEQRLAKRLRDENDVAAARELVLSHLRLVVSVSRGYLGYGLPHADLIQEGNIGLMKRSNASTQNAACASFRLRCIGSKLKFMSTSCATGGW